MAKSKLELAREASDALHAKERAQRMADLIAERIAWQQKQAEHAVVRNEAERAQKAAKRKVEEINAEIVKLATEV